MKNDKNGIETSTLSTDSESRLIAYTTAASLGAFFASHNAEAQIVESQAFAPYPATILPPPGGGGVYIANGPNGFSGYYHYFSIDGSATPEFALTINDPLPANATLSDPNQFIDLVGETTNDLILTPTYSSPDGGGHTNNAYCISFLGGTPISAATGSPPWYQPRLAISYQASYMYNGILYSYNALDNKYITTGALGFEFVSAIDGQTHFGYMDVQVNTFKNSGGFIDVKSVTINDVYYNATPNAPITVPIEVNVTSITVGAGNAVTINFTSNDSSPASNFTLETSPTLGPSANWTADPAASISVTTTAIPKNGLNLTTYQAVTTATGGAAQFYRLSNSN
jgi:hypothetical protein